MLHENAIDHKFAETYFYLTIMVKSIHTVTISAKVDYVMVRRIKFFSSVLFCKDFAI